MTSWDLEDVTATAKAHPDTFFIPSEAERRTQRSGQQVRLHFVLKSPGPDDPRAERMWVEIFEASDVSGMARYRGHITNQPAYIKDLKLGDVVAFGPEHIARTILTADHPDALEIGERKAMVSAAVLEPGAGVRFAYRQQPERPEDSGWRLFAGGESDAWANDAANIRLCNVYWLVDRDPSLREIFRTEVGAVFERATLQGPWQRVTNWAPSEE